MQAARLTSRISLTTKYRLLTCDGNQKEPKQRISTLDGAQIQSVGFFGYQIRADGFDSI